MLIFRFYYLITALVYILVLFFIRSLDFYILISLFLLLFNNLYFFSYAFNDEDLEFTNSLLGTLNFFFHIEWPFYYL